MTTNGPFPASIEFGDTTLKAVREYIEWLSTLLPLEEETLSTLATRHAAQDAKCVALRESLGLARHAEAWIVRSIAALGPR